MVFSALRECILKHRTFDEVKLCHHSLAIHIILSSLVKNLIPKILKSLSTSRTVVVLWCLVNVGNWVNWGNSLPFFPRFHCGVGGDIVQWNISFLDGEKAYALFKFLFLNLHSLVHKFYSLCRCCNGIYWKDIGLKVQCLKSDFCFFFWTKVDNSTHK